MQVPTLLFALLVIAFLSVDATMYVAACGEGITPTTVVGFLGFAAAQMTLASVCVAMGQRWIFLKIGCLAVLACLCAVAFPTGEYLPTTGQWWCLLWLAALAVMAMCAGVRFFGVEFEFASNAVAHQTDEPRNRGQFSLGTLMGITLLAAATLGLCRIVKLPTDHSLDLSLLATLVGGGFSSALLLFASVTRPRIAVTVAFGAVVLLIAVPLFGPFLSTVIDRYLQTFVVLQWGTVMLVGIVLRVAGVRICCANRASKSLPPPDRVLRVHSASP